MLTTFRGIGNRAGLHLYFSTETAQNKERAVFFCMIDQIEETVLKWQCSTCDYLAATKDEIISHIRTAHDRIGEFHPQFEVSLDLTCSYHEFIEWAREYAKDTDKPRLVIKEGRNLILEFVKPVTLSRDPALLYPGSPFVQNWEDCRFEFTLTSKNPLKLDGFCGFNFFNVKKPKGHEVATEFIAVVENHFGKVSRQEKQTEIAFQQPANKSGRLASLVFPKDFVDKTGWDKTLVGMWLDGHDRTEIAERVNVVPDSVTNRITKLRKILGIEFLPYDKDRKVVMRRDTA
jgi:hypothetical protein